MAKRDAKDTAKFVKPKAKAPAKAPTETTRKNSMTPATRGANHAATKKSIGKAFDRVNTVENHKIDTSKTRAAAKKLSDAGIKAGDKDFANLKKTFR